MKMKSLLSLLLAGVMTVLCVVPAFAADLLGDIDGDGKFTADDARSVLRFAVRLEAPTTLQRSNADLDGDGKITASDARTVLRMAVKLETPLSVVLYNTAHPMFRSTFAQLHPNPSIYERALDAISDWCCYYSLHDVYIPVLKKLGYSQTKIDQVAPHNYSKEKLAKAASNASKLNIPKWMTTQLIDWYVPSLLMDYYLEHPEYAQTYVFWEYYDDIIENRVVEPTENVSEYAPQVGDFVFMSNKARTYAEVDGKTYPTVDHTAQIIAVYPDGTFLCTEGSIIQSGEDGKARVRERVYKYDDEKETYVFVNNSIVNIVAICRPILDD